MSININEKNLPVSHLIAIPDGHQREFDHTPHSTADGTILLPNSKVESPVKKDNTKHWRVIANYVSQGLLIVAIITEAICLFYYIEVIRKSRKCSEYKNCFHQTGVQMLSICALACVAVLLMFIIMSVACCDVKTKMDRSYFKFWTISICFFTSLSLIFLLFAIGIGFGDEGINYLFWNKQQPIIDDLNNQNSSPAFSYTVNRTISDESNRYAIPPSEFYDIVANMILNQMNLTETQKFLKKYNCFDRLSFPISTDPLLSPFGCLKGSFNSICG